MFCTSQVEELRDVLEAATVAGVQNEAAGAPQTAHTPPATDKSADESGVVPVDELVPQLPPGEREEPGAAPAD